MKVKAFQIVNFDDPLSMRYLEHSQRSFEPVRDVLEIEPVQCVTPNTIPPENSFKEKDTRTLFEQACFASHYNLVKRLGHGEEFIIMEHDAYLWPDRIDVFYELITQKEKFSAFYLGISNEFYSLNKAISRKYVSDVNNRRITGGPMTTALNSVKHFEKSNASFALWPVYGQKKEICASPSVARSAKGTGIIYKAPVTQHYMLHTGSTIKERANKWKFTPKRNPDMYFTYE